MEGKYSNKKEVNAYCLSLEKVLLGWAKTPEESLAALRRYMKSFPYEIDYNLVEYGNFIINPAQIRADFEAYGLVHWLNEGDDNVWKRYKAAIGAVAECLVLEDS